jgi:hypothetical protein
MKAAGSALPHMSGAQPGLTGTSGTTAMPGWSLPTLDPAELDKRIQELKTVQFWLEQNARMVAMTIQGLEVQRMTLATLQGMNVSMDHIKDALKVKPDAMQGFFKAAASDKPAASPEPAPAPAPRSAGFPWGAANWHQGVPDQAAEPEPAAAPGPSTAAPDGDGGSDDAPDAPAGEATGGERGADLINPMRWWDTLTQQFSHLASQAAHSVQVPSAQAAAAMPDLMGNLTKPFATAVQAAGKTVGKTATSANAAAKPRASRSAKTPPAPSTTASRKRSTKGRAG